MKKVNIIMSKWVEKFVRVLFCGLAYFSDCEDQIFVHIAYNWKLGLTD